MKIKAGDIVKRNVPAGRSVDEPWWSMTASTLFYDGYYMVLEVLIANDMNDIERIKHQPDVKAWQKTKNADNTDEPSEFVPRNILYFNTFVEQVFTSENPMDLIANSKAFLADIRGTRWQRATGGGKGKNNFSTLFEGG